MFYGQMTIISSTKRNSKDVPQDNSPVLALKTVTSQKMVVIGKIQNEKEESQGGRKRRHGRKSAYMKNNNNNNNYR